MGMVFGTLSRKSMKGEETRTQKLRLTHDLQSVGQTKQKKIVLSNLMGESPCVDLGEFQEKATPLRNS